MMNETSKTIAQVIAAGFFVFSFTLGLGIGTDDIWGVLKLTLEVMVIVAPLTFALNRSLAFIEWWNSREIVRYRKARRRITAYTNLAIAKLERGSR
jgi:hypothetical protein